MCLTAQAMPQGHRRGHRVHRVRAPIGNVAKAGRILRAARLGKPKGGKSRAPHGWIDPLAGTIELAPRRGCARYGWVHAGRQTGALHPDPGSEDSSSRAARPVRLRRGWRTGAILIGRAGSRPRAMTGARGRRRPRVLGLSADQNGWPAVSNRKPSRLGIVTEAPLAGFDRRQGRSARARIASDGRRRRMRPSSPTSSIARNP